MSTGSNLFENKSIEHILDSQSLAKIFYATLCGITAEVDKHEIYNKMFDRRWTPLIESYLEPVVIPKTLDEFYTGKIRMMSELKADGIWNSNMGILIRLNTFANGICCFFSSLFS